MPPRNSICPLTGNPLKRRKADALSDSVKDSLPKGLARPALRALANAGITDMKTLAKLGERELLALHGMGPKAMKTIRDALAMNDKRCK